MMTLPNPTYGNFHMFIGFYFSKLSIGLNEEESNKIHNLAQMYQVDLNMDEELVEWPSYETMLTIKPDERYMRNIHSSRTLLQILKTCLLQLSEEQKMSLTTEEWLENMSKNATFDLHDESKLYITFQDTTTSFLVDERLNRKMNQYGTFIGLFHFSLSCSKNQNSIVMKRLHVLDCFTVPYNKTLLKAFQDRTELKPIYSISEWWNFQAKYSATPPDLENSDISHLLDSHDLISLPEMFAVSDSYKIRDIVSAKIEYVSPYEKQSTRFKKVRVPSETSYELPGCGYFELLSNNVSRHFSRLNAADLLLVETILWFDVIPKKEGSEIQSLYKDKLDRIPTGNVLSIHGTAMPTYILCANGQTLKLRRNRKCLQIPEFNRLSKEEKYARVLLYYPLAPGQLVDSDRIDTYYYATDNTTTDSNNQVLTVVEVNERKMFTRLLWTPLQ